MKSLKMESSLFRVWDLQEENGVWAILCICNKRNMSYWSLDEAMCGRQRQEQIPGRATRQDPSLLGLTAGQKASSVGCERIGWEMDGMIDLNDRNTRWVCLKQMEQLRTWQFFLCRRASAPRRRLWADPCIYIFHSYWVTIFCSLKCNIVGNRVTILSIG